MKINAARMEQLEIEMKGLKKENQNLREMLKRSKSAAQSKIRPNILASSCDEGILIRFL